MTVTTQRTGKGIKLGIVASYLAMLGGVVAIGGSDVGSGAAEFGTAVLGFAVVARIVLIGVRWWEHA